MSARGKDAGERECEGQGCGRSMLATLDACKRAKAVLDPGAEGGVTERSNDKETTG